MKVIFVKSIEVSRILINASLDVFNINAYAKFSQNPSSSSQDIEWKGNPDIIQGS